MARLISVALLLTGLIFSGCTARVSTNYPPSILLEGSGQVNIENLIYSPEGYKFNAQENSFEKSLGVDKDGKEDFDYLQPNQIELNGNFGTVLLDKSVAEFITEAVKKEFKYIGYKNHIDSNILISGSILELSVNVNSEIDFITRIQFKIQNKVTGKKYSKLAIGKFSMSKYQSREPTTGLNSSIARAIEDFARSAQGNGML